MKAPTHIGWRASLLAIALLVVAALVIGAVTGINAIGATARMLWNTFVFAVLWSARSIEGLIALVARRRAWRLTSFLISIGFGYAGRVFLSAKGSRRVRGWRDRSRGAIARMRARWLALSTGRKFLVVAVLVAAQLFFLPTAAEYMVLFPIGFMIPLIVLGVRKLYSWAGDLIFAKMYWKYCGRAHQAVVRGCRRLMPVRAVVGASRQARLQYLTAWRLWKYQPRYRDQSGELWVSVLEPLRLWWGRKLDIYIGHPLLSGQRHGPCAATEAGPPQTLARQALRLTPDRA